MGQPLRIALAGLGTVGAGVVKLLDTNHTLIERRAGRPVEVVAVSARDEGNEALMDAGANAVCAKTGFSKIQTVIDNLLRT